MRPVPTARRLMAAAALAGLLALGAAACSTGQAADTDPTDTDADSAYTVVVDDFSYSPDSLTVPVGTTVTWTFEDAVGHNVVSDDFESEVLRDGTFSHTFDEPGTYEYHCSPHPNMTGTIEVTP